MAKVKSLFEMMSTLAKMEAEFAPVAEAAVAACTVKVQADAKKKFGTYQDAVGPYAAWAELKPATILAKERAGATSDDPLIGHYEFKGKHSSRPGGQLRNSILAEVRGLVGEVGTNDELAPYHEFGTNRGIPPRPFLRPALIENEEFIKVTFKAAIATVMLKS